MIQQLLFGKTVFQKNGISQAVFAVSSPRKQNFDKMKIRLAIALMFLAAFTRLGLNLLPHPPYNFSPIGAMALFGAAYFSRQALTLAIPFLALFFSDLILNNVIYQQYYPSFTLITSWWIYAAFGIVMVVGWWMLSRKVAPLRVVAASLTASLIFFLVTNFSVWFEGAMYPKTAAGLMACYTAGLPFLKNTVMGDLFFSGVLFGTYEWALRGKWLMSMGKS